MIAPNSSREAKLAKLRAEVAELESEVAETTPAGDSPSRTSKKPVTDQSEPQQPAEDSDDDDEQDEDAPVSESLTMMLRAAPAWLVSLIAHLILLIILGLWTLANLEKEPRVVMISPAEDAYDEPLEDLTEFEMETLESEEFENELAFETDIPDPGQISLGVPSTTEANISDLGEMALPNSIDQIGALFGDSGKGMAEFGSGFKGAASFFGAKSSGNKFVFVVDNSNSMGKGRMETALNELMQSVSRMEKHQRFYVMFFSDTAYGMFHPKPVRAMTPATTENKRKLEYWLPQVQMCLRTQGREAVQAALAMRPDAIYILGDGAFTDNATSLLTAPHSRRTVIHTVGMEVNERGAKQLKQIAKANGGTYRAVAANEAAKRSARTNPIKRNWTRGPVWGVKLPTERKKK